MPDSQAFDSATSGPALPCLDEHAALDSQAGLVASGVYAQGRRVAAIPVDEARRWLHQPGHVVWIGLVEPQDQLVRRVQAQLGLHDLAIKDAGTAHRRPKLERYGDALFVVARTAQMVDARIAFGETHLFVGQGYIVSVRHGASTSYASVRERCEAFPKTLAHGENYNLVLPHKACCPVRHIPSNPSSLAWVHHVSVSRHNGKAMKGVRPTIAELFQ